VASAIVVISV